MGQKKWRNKERNERKAQQRQSLVSQQNRDHDAALFADGIVQSVQARERPSAEDYPYSILAIIEALDNYQKIDPKCIFIRMESKDVPYLIDERQPPIPENLGAATLWVAKMYANHPTKGLTLLSSGNVIDKDKQGIMRKSGRDCPVLAFEMEDGTFTYPYYDEVKGKFMAEAQARRKRREAKALAQLNTLLSISQIVGGMR